MNLLNEWDAVFEMVPSNPCFVTNTLKDFPPLESNGQDNSDGTLFQNQIIKRLWLLSCVLSFNHSWGSQLPCHKKRPTWQGTESATATWLSLEVDCFFIWLSFEMTAAQAHALTTASWEILSQNHPAKLAAPRFLTYRHWQIMCAVFSC